MKIIIFAMTLISLQAFAQNERVLSYDVRTVSLNNGPVTCQGSAELDFQRTQVVLSIHSTHCQYIEIGGKLESISPSGYPLPFNTSHYFHITSGGKFNDTLLVNTFLPSPNGGPRPIPVHPRPQYP